MLSLLPTYKNPSNFPVFKQGGFNGLPVIFQHTNLKIPPFFHIQKYSENSNVGLARLIEVDYQVLRKYNEYQVLNETDIDLQNIGEQSGTGFLKVFGKPYKNILEENKLYTIFINLSNARKFYTGLFMYCSDNQFIDKGDIFLNANKDYLINADQTKIKL